jgi:hypothetical protein
MHDAFNDYHPKCSNTSSPKVMGWDIEPNQMSLTSQDDIFQHMVTELATVSLIDAKLYLWNNASDPTANRQMVKDVSSESFVAGFEQATSTGTLRNHIMRLNSSVTCERIQRAEFPSVCGGDRSSGMSRMATVLLKFACREDSDCLHGPYREIDKTSSKSFTSTFSKSWSTMLASRTNAISLVIIPSIAQLPLRADISSLETMAQDTIGVPYWRSGQILRL